MAVIRSDSKCELDADLEEDLISLYSLCERLEDEEGEEVRERLRPLFNVRRVTSPPGKILLMASLTGLIMLCCLLATSPVQRSLRYLGRYYMIKVS